MSVPVFRTDWLLSNTEKFWEMTNESVTASALYIYICFIDNKWLLIQLRHGNILIYHVETSSAIT